MRLLPDAGALNVGPCTPPSTMLTAALHDCLPRGPPSRVVDHQQFWPSRHPRSSSLRLPARCFRLHRLSIALHQSQLYFKPKSRTQHMSFTSSSTTNPDNAGTREYCMSDSFISRSQCHHPLAAAWKRTKLRLVTPMDMMRL